MSTATASESGRVEQDHPIDVEPSSGRLLSMAELRRALQFARDGGVPRAPRIPSLQDVDVGPGLPVRRVDGDSVDVWVVGASGGAGESVLAELLSADGVQRCVAAGHRWPATAGS